MLVEHEAARSLLRTKLTHDAENTSRHEVDSLVLAVVGPLLRAGAPSGTNNALLFLLREAILIAPDNFVPAEEALYFTNIARFIVSMSSEYKPDW